MSTAQAATITWDGGGDGLNWSDAANWSSNAVPDFADDVIIDAPGDITVRYANIQPQVNSLINRETLSIEGRTTGRAELQVAGLLENEGTIVLTTTSNDGLDRSAAIVLGDFGVLDNLPGATILIAAGQGDSRSIRGGVYNEGTITVEAGITLDWFPVFRPDLEVRPGDGGDKGLVGPPIFIREEFVHADGVLNADGPLELNGGTVDWIGGTITGSNKVSAINSSVFIDQAVTDNGTLYCADFCTLRGNESTTARIFVDGNTVYGAADLYVFDGVLNRGIIHLETTSNDGLDRSAELFISSFGGVLTNAPSGIIESALGTGDGRRIRGPLVNQGHISSPDVLTTFDGQLTGDGGTYDGNIQFISSTLDLIAPPSTSTSLDLRGLNNVLVSDIPPGYTLLVQGSTGGRAALTVDGPSINEGTVVLDTLTDDGLNRGASLNISTGVFVNAGVIDVRGTASEDRALRGAFNNQGDILVETNVIFNIYPDTSGFTLTDGTLDIGNEIRVQGELFTYLDGDINGILRVVNGQIDIESSVTGIQTVRVSRSASTLIKNAGAGVTLMLEGENLVYGRSELTPLAGAYNDGTILLTTTSNDGLDRGARLDMFNGPFLNRGTIRSLVGTGDNRLLRGELINEGLVIADDGIQTRFDGTFISNGGRVEGEDLFFLNSFIDVAVSPIVAPQILHIVSTGNRLTSDIASGTTLWIDGNSSPWGRAELVATQLVANAGIVRMETTLNDGSDRGVRFRANGGFINLPGGRIEALAGTGDNRRFYGDLVNQGTIEVEPGTLLQLLNASFTQASGTLDLGGTLRVQSGDFIFSGGTVLGVPEIYNSSITLIDSPDPITMRTVLTRNTLESDIPENATIIIDGSSTLGRAVLTTTNSVINAGTLAMVTSVNDGFDRGTRFVINGGGTLFNTSSGRIETLGGGDERRIQAELVNEGVMRVEQSTLITTTEADHINRGFIGVRDGAVVNVIGNSLTQPFGGYIGGNGSLSTPATFTDEGRVDFDAPAIMDLVLDPALIQVAFYAPAGMDPTTVNNLSNYALTDAGPDQIVGTADDTDLSGVLDSVSFDASNQVATILLDPAAPSLQGQFLITFDGPNLLDLAGEQLYPESVPIGVANGVLPTVVKIDLPSVQDTGRFNNDDLTRIAAPIVDIDINKPGTVRISIDGTLFSVSTNLPGVFPVQLPMFSDGDYIIDVVLIPDAGNTASNELELAIDTTPLRLVPGPATEAAPWDFRLVTYSEVPDNASIPMSDFTLTKDGITTTPSTYRLLGTTTELRLDPPLVDTGEYVLVVQTVADIAGNITPSLTQTITLLLDTATPSVVTLIPDSTVVNGFINDPLGGFEVRFSELMDDASFTAADVTLPGTSTVQNIIALGNGRYDVVIDPPITLNGDLPITIGPDILDLSGNDMIFPFETVVRLDSIGPQVVSITESDPGPLPLIITFDSEMDKVSRTDAMVVGPEGAIPNNTTTMTRLSSNVFEFTFPVQNTPGQYTVTIGPNALDQARNAMDQNGNSSNGEADDTFTYSFGQDLPDLAVVNPVVPAGPFTFGDTITVSLTATNIGNGNVLSTQSWQDALWLSTDSVIDDGDTQLFGIMSQTIGFGLAAGESATLTTVVNLPAPGTLPDGDYFLILSTDDGNEIVESDETNNTIAFEETINNPALPDLSTTGITALATSVEPGTALGIFYHLSNLSSTNIPAGTDRVLLERADGSAVTFPVSRPALAAGEGTNVQTQVLIPELGLSGDITLRLELDPTNQILESNETNNRATAADQVNIPASLTLGAVLNSTEEGGPQLRVTIERNGDLAAALPVALAFDDSSEFSGPTSAIIPAGQAGTAVFYTPLPDNLNDGDQTVTLTVSAANANGDAIQLTATDADIPVLIITATNTSLTEGQSVVATVSRGIAAPTPLTVTLIDTPDELLVPTSVEIPANAAKVDFQVLATDDGQFEPDETVALSATASGAREGILSFTVIDNDTPAVTATPQRLTASEGDGATAIPLTLTRTPINDSRIEVALTSTRPDVANVPATVFIQPNQAQAVFNVAAVDDAVLDGDQPVQIIVQVIGPLGEDVGSPILLDLTIIDDEGPALQLSLNAELAAEGVEISGFVTRNTDPAAALVVSLTSDNPAEATVPGSATIPAGETTVPFTITTLEDGVNDGNQPVSIVAAAAGLAPDSAVLVVTDINLPDLVATGLSLPASAVSEAFVPVDFTVLNQGDTNAVGAMVQRIYISDDAVIGDDILASQVLLDTDLPAGTELTRSITIRLPQTPGNYWLVVEVDATNAVDEVLEGNNLSISALPVVVDPAYTVTLNADVTAAPAGTPITFSGAAVRTETGAPATFEQVNIRIQVRDTERLLAAFTDNLGNYELQWTPLPSEAGAYTALASQPGVTNPEAQVTFTLYGFEIVPAESEITLIEGGSTTRSFILRNLSDVPLTGLTATLATATPLPGNLTLDPVLGSTTLLPNSEIGLDVTLGAIDASTPEVTLVLNVQATESLAVPVTLEVDVTALMANLVATPNELIKGMVRGGQCAVELTVVNEGGANTGPLDVIIPPEATFLSLASSSQISLAPGETQVISLLLTPPEDIPLSEFNGYVLLNAPGVVAPELAVPFSFRAVSDALGDLRLETVDEFFYFADGAPRLTNATVRLLDPFNGNEITNAVSDSTGFATLTDVREGYYQLRVTADKHQAYSDVIFVDSARLNTELAFLQRETVSYNWVVEEIDIEDRTRITIESTFETVVPVPVLVLENGILDLNDLRAVGQSKQIDMTIRNEGLINAINVRFQFPNSPDYDISPLIENIGVMPPLSSLTVPVTVTRLTPLGARSAREQAKAGGKSGGDKSLACAAACLAWAYVCGPFNVGKCTSIPIINDDGRNCTASPIGFGGFGGFSFSGTPIGFSSPFECDCTEIEFCLSIPIGASAAVDAVAKQAVKGTKFVPQVTISKPELSFDGELCYKRCCEGKKSNGWQVTGSGKAELKAEATVGVTAGVNDIQLGNIGGYGVELEADVKAGLFGELSVNGDVTYESGCGTNKPKICVNGQIKVTASVGAKAEAEIDFESPTLPDGEVESFARLEATLNTGASGNVSWCNDGKGPMGNVCWDGVTGVLKGEIELPNGVKASVGTTQTFAEPCCTGANGCGQDKSTIKPNDFVPNAEATLDFDVPDEDDPVFDQVDVDAEFLALELGYTSLRNMQDALGLTIEPGPLFGEELFRVLDRHTARSVPPSEGVCARVKLRLDQDAVLTRTAFRATLELNNSTALPLTDILVQPILFNEAGEDVSDLFGIRAPNLDSLSGVDGFGLIGANTAGSAQWVIIPTDEAAGSEPIQYFLGGILAYTEEGNAVQFDLEAAPITVYPQAELALNYFHQRDVFSDDPFTDEIEPAQPYILAVMVQNAGAGAARNLSIASAQPEIIENEKGLLIGFKILATEIAGESATPSLTADFGTIAPGEIKIGKWLLESTLQGQFIDYSATFEHIDGLNDPRLSLIKSVDIHELIQEIDAFGDGVPDFLVNDIPDLFDEPDTLYLGDGSVEPVNVITGSVSGLLTGGVLEVSLTLPAQAGWSYLKLPDPGEGLYPILELRRPDGSVIPAENVWQTDRTFIGNGRRPVLEDNLHLVDQDVGGTYTIVYAPPSIPTTLLPPIVLGCGEAAPNADDAIASLSNSVGNLCALVTITFVDVTDEPGCTGVANIERVFTITTDCAGTLLTTQLISTVDDAIPLILSSPVDQDLGCAAVPAADAYLTDLSVTGGCAALSINVVDAAPLTNGCDVIVVRTTIISSDCGKSANTSQILRFQAPPAAPVCPSDMTVELGQPAPPADPSGVQLDDCAAYEVSVSTNTLVDRVVYEYSVTNACGQQVSCSQTIFTSDTTPPVVTAPADVDAACAGLPAADAFIDQLVIADDCPVTSTQVTDLVVGSTGCVITVERTYTASNACGLVASATQTIRYTQIAAPDLAALCPDDLTLACGEAIPPAVSFTQDCASVFVIESDGTPTCVGIDFERVYIFTTDCGDQSSCTQQITFVDATPPFLASAPLNGIYCAAEYPPAEAYFNLLEATEDCAGSVITTNVTDSPTTNNGCDISFRRTYSFVNSCGLTNSASHVIRYIAPGSVPVDDLECPDDIILECGSPLPDLGTNTPHACGEFRIQTNELTGGCAGPGILVVREVSGFCGGATTACFQRVTFRDTTPPTFSGVPGPEDLGCNPASIPEPAIPASLVASDICSSNPSVSISNVELQTNGCQIVRTVTIRATDDCLNRATTNVVTTWTVAHTMIPADVCLPDRILPCAPVSAAPAELEAFRANLAGLCVASSDVSSSISDACGSGSIIAHVYTAQLECGGLITCTQTMWTTDDQAPVVTAPADLDLGCNPVSIPEPVGGAFTATNLGCSAIANSELSTSVITNGGARALIVVLTAVNECGRSASATQMIVWTVSDAGLGILPIPTMDLGCNPATIPEPDASIVMPAGLQVAVGTISESTNACTVTRLVEYLVTDACNNAGSITQVVTWSEAGAAAFVDLSGAMDEMVTCVAGAIPQLSATDGCGSTSDVATPTVETLPGGTDCTRSERRVWTFVGACGATISHTQTVTVIAEPPSFMNVPADIAIDCRDPIPSVSPTVTASACGNSLDLTSTFTEVPKEKGQDLRCGELVRTWSATGPCGSIISATQIISIVEDIPPVLTIPADVDLGCNPTSLPVADPALASATDNCFIDGITAEGRTFTNGTARLFEAVYTATDACGNQSTLTQSVTYAVGNCEPPPDAVASVEFDCAAGVSVSILNPKPGSSYTTTLNGQTADGTQVTFPTPPNGKQAVSVIENPAGRVVEVTPNGFTVNCAPPTATAAFDCDTGLITVTLTGGETDNGFQLAVTNPNDDIAAQSGTIAVGATTNLTFPISGDGTYSLAGFEDNIGAVLQIVPTTLNIDCPEPSEAKATAVFNCTDGLIVSVMSPLAGASYVTTFNGLTAVGTRTTFPVIPANGNLAVRVVENPSGRVVEVTPSSITVGCAPPTATAAFDCDTGLITVTVTGGQTDNGFQLAVTNPNDDIATQSGTIAAGATATVTFPISDDGNYSVRGFEDNNGAVMEILPNAFFIDCPEPPTGSIRLEKTVYRGHDNGLGCPGQESIRVRRGRDITYCFTVQNIGQTPLTQIMVVDEGLTPLFMGEVRDLAPGERASLFYETSMGDDQVNTATVTAVLADGAGDPIPNSRVSDEDSAQVDNLRYDLALFQSPFTRGPFAVGRDLRFRIRVRNQGEIPARNIELVNIIPPGLRLADTTWTLISPNRARYNFLLPRGFAQGTGDDLLPGEEVYVTINLVVEEEAAGMPITNVVEITAATDETGAVISDIDSVIGGGASSEDDIAQVEVEILPPSVTLGERVWIDRNFNGIQDPDEPGVADVVVQAVAASNGMVFGTATSDVNGVFAFLGLPMGNFALDYDLGSLPDGFVPTTYLDGRSPNTGLLLLGDSNLDLGLAVWQPASAAGIVWFDLNGDGSIDFDNAGNLGIANLTVRLYRIEADGSRTLLDMVLSAARGGFEFPALLPGTYEVEADTPAESADLMPSTMTTKRFTVGFGLRVDDLNFGFTPRPTAIGLESFDAELTAEGVSITWTTAWEENTLGFYLYRIDATGQATRVNDVLILARGGDTYQLTDPGVPGGRYWLEEIDDDLTSTVQEEEAIARVPATPLGTPTETRRTTTDKVTIAETSARSYLVVGFTRAPQVIDQTDPDFPLQLVGEHLQTAAGHATYFSPSAGRKIVVRGGQ